MTFHMLVLFRDEKFIAIIATTTAKVDVVYDDRVGNFPLFRNRKSNLVSSMKPFSSMLPSLESSMLEYPIEHHLDSK
jgi:hypothetical protein